MKKLLCACGAKTKLTTRHKYGIGGPDVPIWACQPCDSWVGCHPKSTKPLGTPADAQLRRARVLAHEALDPLWQAKMDKHKVSNARDLAYKWLARELGLTKDECHIGRMDLETCNRVVELCEEVDG